MNCSCIKAEIFTNAQNKKFYVLANDEYTIHVTLGDSTYCKIRTEQVIKRKPGYPIVEGMRFGWGYPL
jgi:hypothetical protein